MRRSCLRRIWNQTGHQAADHKICEVYCCYMTTVQKQFYNTHHSMLLSVTLRNKLLTFQLLPNVAGEPVIWPDRVRKSSCGKPLKLPHRPQSCRLNEPRPVKEKPAWLWVPDKVVVLKSDHKWTRYKLCHKKWCFSCICFFLVHSLYYDIL